MGREDIDRIKGIRISRLPKKVREEFKEFAKEEYADDFGMALTELWNKYKEYLVFYNNFDIKLDYIIQLLNTEEKPDEEKIIKTLSGRRVLKGGNENE